MRYELAKTALLCLYTGLMFSSYGHMVNDVQRDHDQQFQGQQFVNVNIAESVRSSAKKGVI